MRGSFRAAVARGATGIGRCVVCFASCPKRVILEAFGPGKMALARLDLLSCRDCLGVSFPMLEHGSFLPRRSWHRLIAWHVAQRFHYVFGGHGRLLHRPRRPPRSGLPPTGLPDGRATWSVILPKEWLWNKRHVRVVDGSTITMPDTPANQAEYPQMAAQKPGCGFPIARVVVVFSLAVGSVLNAAIGPYKGKQTGENSLFRASTTLWLPATSRCLTAISAAGSTSPCWRCGVWMWSSASISFAAPIFAKGSDWERVIIWSAGANRSARSGCLRGLRGPPR